MNLDLNDEHRLLEGSVREWAGRAVAPRIRDLDRAHQFDRNLLPQMAELGLLGVCIPPVYGGAGMSQDTPLAYFYTLSRTLRFADGPDEVHRNAIAKLELGKVMPKA